MTSYVTMQLQCVAAFGGLRAKQQATANEGSFVLPSTSGESSYGYHMNIP